MEIFVKKGKPDEKHTEGKKKKKSRCEVSQKGLRGQHDKTPRLFIRPTKSFFRSIL